MASASGIRAGLAYIELYANDARLVKGLNAAAAKLKAFGAAVQDIGTKMSLAGAAIVTPLLASAKSFSDVGDALDKMSARTGISVEALSEIGFAADQSGTSLDDVETAVRKMQKTIAASAGGSKQAIAALAELGLTAEQLLRLSPEDQFTAISKRLSEISDPALRAAATMSVFGKSGTALTPLIGDLQSLRAEAQALGFTMSTDAAKAAAALNDAFGRVKTAVQTVANAIGAALTPLLIDVSNQIVAVLGDIRRWINENRGLIVSALKIGAVVAVAGAALVGLGVALATAGSIIGGIVSGITGAISAISTAITIVTSLGPILAAAASGIAAVFGAIITPAGIVIALLIGLATYGIYASGVVGQALDYLGARFDDLKSAGMESLQGIKDALAAGDISLAARILWLSLKAAWQKGIFELNTLWLGFKEQFLSVATGAFYGAVALVAEAFYGLRTIWTQTINFWSDVLDRFAGFFVKTWNELTGFLAKQLTELEGTFDSSINVTAINKQIDRETQQKNTQVSRQNLDARLGREADLQGIEQERKGVISAIATEAGNEDTQRRAKFAAELTESEKALEEARGEWKAAIEQARTQRSAKESEAANRTPLPEINLPDITQRAQSVLDVSGTFNASAIAQLGVGSTATERTAKASEETARNTKRIIQKMDEEGATFE